MHDLSMFSPLKSRNYNTFLIQNNIPVMHMYDVSIYREINIFLIMVTLKLSKC